MPICQALFGKEHTPPRQVIDGRRPGNRLEPQSEFGQDIPAFSANFGKVQRAPGCACIALIDAAILGSPSANNQPIPCPSPWERKSRNACTSRRCARCCTTSALPGCFSTSSCLIRSSAQRRPSLSLSSRKRTIGGIAPSSMSICVSENAKCPPSNIASPPPPTLATPPFQSASRNSSEGKW